MVWKCGSLKTLQVRLGRSPGTGRMQARPNTLYALCMNSDVKQAQADEQEGIERDRSSLETTC